MTQVLFICHGNRFRSPFAEGMLRLLLGDSKIAVTSAGVKDPIGSFPAARPTRLAAEARGFDLSGHRARAVSRELLEGSDLVLHMDAGNLRRLHSKFPGLSHRSRCLGGYVGVNRVPDPCFTTDKEPIWSLIERACRSLVKREGL